MRMDKRWLVTLAVLICAACASVAGRDGSSSRAGQGELTLEEIDAAGATNAYDLIQARRPAWLRLRGTQSFNESARGVGGGTGAGAGVSSTPGQTPILIYLGAARIGGPEALRQIDPRTIQSIEYLQRAAADYRFGQGHLHGAIVLTPRQ
jgi:hypothetical protein